MRKLSTLLAFAALLLAAGIAAADEYADTIARFQKAGQSAGFFNDCYGYAVFPTISKGALLIGGARGGGRVYEQGNYVGDTTMTQLSIGLQAGGEAYSQIIFLKDKRAFDEFTQGNFEFDANASAVAITASASTSTGTTGSSAELSGGQSNAGTAGQYYKGMAVFTIVKGGALVAAAVAGQKFSYKPHAPAQAPSQATQAPPPASQQPAAAPAAPPPPGYQQPPPGYQQPPPGYQPPPPNNPQPPPTYQQAPPNYPQPPPTYQQAPPNYPQPPPTYQQAPPNYPQPPPQ